MADLRFDDVSCVYPNGARALTRLTLHLGDGELVALVGPSGSGKTTALRVAAGLERVTEGEIRIGGRLVNDLAPGERDVAMVSEHGALSPNLVVADNIALGLRLRKVPAGEIRKRVGAEARVLRLTRLLGRLPAALSSGQRRRVGLGRALVRVPRVYLLDEPLTHVDPPERARLRSEVARLVKGLGVTTLYVTHDQAEAMAVGERVGVLRGGRLEQAAAPRELYARPGSLFVAGFVGDPPASLLPALVDRAGGDAVLAVGPQRLPLPAGRGRRLLSRPGREVVLAVRPEHVHPATGAPGEAALAAVVAQVAALGDHDRVACTLDAPPVHVPGEPPPAPTATAELLARLAPGSHLRPGRPLRLAVDLDRVHLFDPRTGAALDYGS
ncbi:MAG TPA: ABC transporter ATP-binding protein [Actinomycetes bacterium]|nr:ABC transporter ATP-binding protein [Actinomycetes bacterium]